MDLLLITYQNKSHYVHIKDFNFCKYCLQCLQEHKKTCSEINIKKTVKLKSGSIKFKNHFKQLAVPFKIYADFKSLLKGVKSSDKHNNTS